MQSTINDHDLLVRLDAKLDILSTLFAEVRSGLTLKADSARVEKLEKNVDRLGNKAYMAVGALAAIQFGLHWILK